ncbi:MAG: hypothetical protein AB1730_14005 [Myxococcota bacterium]
MRQLWVLLVGLMALGATCGPPDIPIVEDPAACPPPTGAQCANPKTPCDRYFVDQAKSDLGAACNLLYDQSVRSEASQYPTQPALTAKTFGPKGWNEPDASIKDVRQFPENTRAPDGGTVKYVIDGPNAFQLDGELEKYSTPSFGGAPTYNPALLLLKRKPWEDNGEAVASCREYVHEKFYDYRSFVDRVIAARAAREPRRVVDIAYAPGPSAPRWAIGTRHIVDGTLYQRDGVTPSGLVVPFEDPMPKNDYFRVPLSAGDSKVIFEANPTGEDQVIVDNLGLVPPTIRMKHLSRELKLEGLVFQDATLTPVIADGGTFYQESFAWHGGMNLRNQGILDEQLYLYDQRKAEFLKLLALRQDIASAIAASVSRKTDMPKAVGNEFAGAWFRDPFWNPDPTAAQFSATQGFDVTSGLNQHPGSSLNAPIVAFASYQNPLVQDPSKLVKQSQTPAQVASIIPKVEQACATATSHLDGGVPSINQLICLAYRLEAIDKQIEDELKKARTDGCLSLSTSGPAPCDWSPALFSSRLLGLFAAEQEEALNRCLEAVDSFTQLENRAFVYTNSKDAGVNYPAQSYTQSPSRAELYFQRLDEYLNVLGEDVGPLLSRKPDGMGRHPLRLSRTEGDSFRKGNDWFGAKLSYSAGFALEEVDNADECVLETRANGSFRVDARAIGAEIPVLEASLEADTQRIESNLDIKVLGKSWTIDEPIGKPAYQDSELTTHTFVEGHAYIQIGFITIKVGGAISGFAGYLFQLGSQRQLTPAMPNANPPVPCKAARIGVGASIQPVMGLQGSAYAAVEALVARAGVKGYLTIISVGVPFQGNLSIGPDPATQVIDARFELGAELKLEFLSGRIAVFLEIGVCPVCEDIEATIVRWGGTPKRFKLFDYGLSVTLGDLKRIAGQEGVLDP